MNYFQELSAVAEQLDRKGEDYLSKLSFMSNDDIHARLWEIANKLFKESNENWDTIPEWAANILDGHWPYCIPRNGSLNFVLGFSPASNDAHLRNFLEQVEGRETQELDFPVIAEVEVPDEKPIKKSKKRD